MMRNAFFTFTFFGLSVLVLYGGFDHRSCQPKERIYFSLQMTKCKKKKKRYKISYGDLRLGELYISL